MSIREALKRKSDELVRVETPWGEPIHLRTLSVRAQLELPGGDDDVSAVDRVAYLISRSLCESNGIRVYGDADSAEIADLDGDVANFIVREVRKLNKCLQTADEVAAAGKA